MAIFSLLALFVGQSEVQVLVSKCVSTKMQSMTARRETVCSTLLAARSYNLCYVSFLFLEHSPAFAERSLAAFIVTA